MPKPRARWPRWRSSNSAPSSNRAPEAPNDNRQHEWRGGNTAVAALNSVPCRRAAGKKCGRPNHGNSQPGPSNGFFHLRDIVCHQVSFHGSTLHPGAAEVKYRNLKRGLVLCRAPPFMSISAWWFRAIWIRSAYSVNGTDRIAGFSKCGSTAWLCTCSRWAGLPFGTNRRCAISRGA